MKRISEYLIPEAKRPFAKDKNYKKLNPKMKKAVEQSLRDTEIDLTLTAAKQPGSQIFATLDDTKYFGEALKTVDVQTAIRNLRRANRLY